MTEEEFLIDYPNKNKKLELQDFVLTEERFEDFISNFIKKYNLKYYTISREGEKVEEITGLDKNRSVEEVFVLTKFYFPKVTLSEYLDFLIAYSNDGRHGVMIFWCCDIKKPVIYRVHRKYSCGKGVYSYDFEDSSYKDQQKNENINYLFKLQKEILENN